MKIVVKAGDSLWQYSQLFNVPINLIEQSNPNINPKELTIGEVVHIPGYRLKTYSVKTGDSLWEIASLFNVSIEIIKFVNPNLNSELLQIHELVNVPIKIQERIVSDPSKYTYDKLLDDLKTLEEVYPFIQTRSIGKSVLGKDLIEIRVGTGQRFVNMNGSFHANEWITTPILMYFLNDYLLSLTQNIPLESIYVLPYFQQTTLSIVPMVNPDGVNLVINGADSAESLKDEVLAINDWQEDFATWKANIHGVDLNNQFPALWEIEAERKPTIPSPRDYPGPYPLSEPESQAMAHLAVNEQFDQLYAYHTQGEVIFWGFEGLEPQTSETIVKNLQYISGFEPIRYVDSYAGYKDWFIQDFRRPGFTVELGRGQNPLPIEQFAEIYTDSLGLLVANLYE